MIQIDDAGNGAVLGGEVIGALRVETGEYVCKGLSLSSYAYLEIFRNRAARQIVVQLLQELGHRHGEEITFCTGDIFKEAKEYLSQHEINWQEEKITGTLQELVEASFFNSLRQYGLPESFRPYHHDYHKFHNMVLGWVCQDFRRRSLFCKPLRLNSALIARAKLYQTVVQKKLSCIVCGEEMEPGTLAVLDKNGETAVYSHVACFPSTVELGDFQEAEFKGQLVRSFVNRFSAPPLCSHCHKPVKYKKRVALCEQAVYHFSCFTSLVKDAFPDES